MQKLLIKRAIGLPGDHIEINNGMVNINEQSIKEDYIKNNEYSGTFYVPEGKILFLGDNRKDLFGARRWINLYIDASEIKREARIRINKVLK